MAGKRRGPAMYVCTIGYVEWHEEAERRIAAGERSVKCDRGRFYFPAWVEDRARHRDFHRGETCSALSLAQQPVPGAPKGGE